MDKIRVGYVALSKTSFDIVLAQETYEQSIASVRALANVEPLIFDGVVATMDDAERASAFFEAQRPDLLIIQCATFHIGSLPQIITRHVTAPLVLWGVPEPPMNGEHLRANSLCAINMDASTFKKTGRKYTTLFGAPDDPETIKELSTICSATAVVKTLAASRIGLVGYHVPGFQDLAFDETALKRDFGLDILHIDIAEVLDRAENAPAADVRKTVAEMDASAKRENVDEAMLEKSARLYLALMEIAHNNNLAGLAVKCWPEFQNLFGIFVCSTLGKLNDAGLLCSCEGDVGGLMTMMMQAWLVKTPVFFADFIATDPEENTGIAWHCGSAPWTFAATSDDVKLRIYRGGVRGIAAEFPMRPGQVTMARLSFSPEGYRMLLETGTALETELIVRGNPMKIKFDHNVQRILNAILDNGVEHHFSIVYADLTRVLTRVCTLLNIPLINTAA